MPACSSSNFYTKFSDRVSIAVLLKPMSFREYSIHFNAITIEMKPRMHATQQYIICLGNL